MKHKKNIFAVLATLLVVPSVAFGQTVNINDPLNGGTVYEALVSIATFLFNVATPIFVIVVLVSAFLMIFSAGDTERFAKGKKMLIYAIMAYVIILIAFGLPALIGSIVGT